MKKKIKITCHPAEPTSEPGETDHSSITTLLETPSLPWFGRDHRNPEGCHRHDNLGTSDPPW